MRVPPPRSVLQAAAPWAAAFLAACTSQPTIDAPRPLDQPVHSAARLFDLFLAPPAVARDAHEVAARAESMLADELEFGPAFASGGQMLDRELHGLAQLPADAKALTADEIARLHALRASAAWSAFDPAARVAALRDDLADLPRLLQLDRRAMGEPDDYRHRTDPADDHPEAGVLPRLLRRIFP